MKLLDHLRSKPEWKSEDPVVRRAAVAALEDPALLTEIAEQDPDEKVRGKALDVLHGIALEAEPEVGLVALAAIQDPKSLVSIARSATHEEVSRGALVRLEEPRGLSSVARHSRHIPVCLEALDRMTDPPEFGLVARKTEHKEVALAALKRLVELSEGGDALADLLTAIVDRARCEDAANRARTLLKKYRPEPKTASPRRETDRGRQTQLCQAMEEMAEEAGCDELAARISQIKEAWVDLVPDVDEDLEKQFELAYQAARDRLGRNRIEAAQRQQMEQERTEFASRYLAPREELCRKVESLPVEKTEKELEAARWEWDHLPQLKHEEVLALEEKFRSACALAEERFLTWRSETTEARKKLQREASREEKARLQAANLTKQEQFCSRLEQALESETLTLKVAARNLRKIRTALEAPGPFPTKADRSRVMRRLKSLQGALYPKVGELRESEEWKRWANARVQEELCVEAEKLREVENALEASRKLADIQQRWRKASVVRQDQAQELWNRFKAVRDEVRGRLKEFQLQQAEEKEALCRRAEELAPSSEWIKTADALKRLQREWKKLGPARRSQDRQLWDRFRKACDGFFNRRKEDLKERKQVWHQHLEAKQALCSQAEALADSSDWKEASEAIKKLQVEWKKIGPVGKKQSDMVWARFRAACDRFFDRFHRRHDIDRQNRLAAREAVCAELESLIPSPVGEASPPSPHPEREADLNADGTKDASAPTPPSEPPAGEAESSMPLGSGGEARAKEEDAVHSSAPTPPSEPPSAESPGLAPAGPMSGEDSVAAGETGDGVPKSSAPVSEADLPARLEEIRRRWQACGSVGGAEGEAVAVRFNQALGRILDGYQVALAGTDFDPAKNIARMEELCRQVEKLVPKDKGLDDSAASPAARLAAQWVEAMAANTIGGGLTDESRWRAATEDVSRAQAAWQKIGYVPEESRRPLAGRFDRACKRFFEHRDRYCPPAAVPKPGTKSGSRSGVSRRR